MCNFACGLAGACRYMGCTDATGCTRARLEYDAMTARGMMCMILDQQCAALLIASYGHLTVFAPVCV